MEKVKNEMLERVKYVKSMEEYNLEMLGKSDKIEIDDVKYLGEANLKYEENGKKQVYKINVYAVIEGKTIKYYSDEIPLAAETQGVGKRNQEIISSPEFQKIFEKDNSIKDIIENLKQKEIEEQEKPEQERKVVSLNELEKQKESRGNNKEEKEEDEKEKSEEESYKISNLKGKVDLDQQVNGETLRKILGLGEEYKSIAPVPASSIGVKSNSKYCFVAVKADNTCKVLEDDIIVEDRQEGTNPYDKDAKVGRDGSISQESSISGFKIVNRPNLYLTVGFDQNSSTRETSITDVSGRRSRREEIGYELEKKGDGWQNSEARNSRMKEEGIGKSDEMKDKQNSHKNAGEQNDRIENIDEREDNNIYNINPSDKIEDTEITWKQFATMCNYEGENGVIQAYKEFMEHKKADPTCSNKEIVEQVRGEREKKENEDKERVPWDSGRIKR